MELWDLYDENRNPAGREHIRGNDIPDGYYHIVVHVWIRNSKGQYLISQRSANRPNLPLMWETVGGSVLKGETSLQGAVREVKEEVGIDVNGTENNLVFSQVRKVINGKKFNDILDVWLFEYNGEVQLDNATTDEVEQTKWLNVAEIKELYESKQLVSTLGYFFDKIGGQDE